jgi:hypothetical protein
MRAIRVRKRPIHLRQQFRHNLVVLQNCESNVQRAMRPLHEIGYTCSTIGCC